MVDLNRLAKLQELRQGGALSDEEFQAQKERLLSSEDQLFHRRKLVLALAGFALLFGAITAGYLIAQPNANPKSTVISTGNPVPTTFDPTTTATEPAADAASKIISPAVNFQWAMNSTVIGLNPRYVESKLGIAKEKSADYLIFEIEGCEVHYGVKGNQIVSARSPVNAMCQPVIDGRRITPNSTFGSVAGTYSKLISDCIFNCGNAADPTIDLYTPGYRANGVIDVIYHGGYGDISSGAMDRWANAIRRQHGVAEDDWANSNFEWFSCVTDAPREVSTAMRAERIIGVTIGRDVKLC